MGMCQCLLQCLRGNRSTSSGVDRVRSPSTLRSRKDVELEYGRNQVRIQRQELGILAILKLWLITALLMSTLNQLLFPNPEAKPPHGPTLPTLSSSIKTTSTTPAPECSSRSTSAPTSGERATRHRRRPGVPCGRRYFRSSSANVVSSPTLVSSASVRRTSVV